MAKRPQLSSQDLRPLVEAALFATATPLSVDDLVEILHAPTKRIVKEALEALVADYAARADSALEIGLEGGYILQVRTMYQKVVDRLLPVDLPPATLRTLTLIAARQPILQKDVVDFRGSGAYDHIKDLVERGLVDKDAQGNSYLLRVGPRFADYFRLDESQLETYLASLRKADQA